MIVDPANAPRSGTGGAQSLHLSAAGGLTQFGAYVVTLAPGAWSSQRHWHSCEDEFLYVLQGTATLHDNDGPHDLSPGDAACWPHGVPNAHHLTNNSTGPVSYLIVGTRVAGDICHYPDTGQRQVNEATTWAVQDANGNILRQGDLPAELLNLPPVWGSPPEGSPPDGHPVTTIHHAATTQWGSAANPAHPILGPGAGPYDYLLLSDPGGISQFGAFIEELPPGSASSERHWHENEDELILMLSGTLTLIEDTHHPLHAGDMACWPAGTPVAHRLENHSTGPARYLVIGTRKQHDIIHYSDHDLITHKNGPARAYFHRDGTPYPAPQKD